jgi:anti-sigma B factor antagonist
LVVTPEEGGSDDRHVYSLHGPLTLANLLTVQEPLRSSASVLVLDFSDVPYVDSAGIGALVQSFIARKKQGKRLLVVAPNETVTKLFKLTSVDTVLEVFPTLEAAR